MKVSKEQKLEHQQRFIQAFIAEVRERGYAAVSLRDVARRSGMSDGAIYKHFASKEKILLAYYLLKMEGLRKEGAVLLGRKGYTLQERLQALLEFQIGQYEGERDFLEKTFHATFVAASLMWPEVAAMRRTYLETAGAFIKAAESDGEIPEVPWAGIVDEMLWCHYMGVMMYWLKDASENHEDTTQFLDRTVNLFAAVVGGPLLKQAEELVGFLVNRHLMPLLMNLGSFGGSKAGYGAQPPPKRKPEGKAQSQSKTKTKTQSKAQSKAKPKPKPKPDAVRAQRGRP
jgi:AcrR family transcriptional regulator